jgi:hypothetical protein
MSTKEADVQRTEVVTHDPDRKARLKRLGGSQSDHWNNVLANQTVNALWLAKDAETRHWQYSAAAAALSGIEPKDEVEGMIAAQLIAAHNATMECYRRLRTCTMRNNLPMHRSPRCGAKTRTRSACQAPAMPNGRCRMTAHVTAIQAIVGHFGTAARSHAAFVRVVGHRSSCDSGPLLSN